MLSDQIAVLRNQWHDTEEKGKPEALDAVLPNPAGDMEYLLHRLRCLQLEDTIVDATFRDYDHLCQVTYSEMFPKLGCSLSEEVLQRISAFLGVDYNFNTTPWSSKSVPRPLWEVVTNWQQVCATLRGTQFESFLADEPMFQDGSFQKSAATSSVPFSTAADLLARVESR